jgi:hypothetical protein
MMCLSILLFLKALDAAEFVDIIPLKFMILSPVDFVDPVSLCIFLAESRATPNLNLFPLFDVPGV